MFGKMLSGINGLLGSGFDAYLSRVQLEGTSVAPKESEARRDYIEILRIQSGIPW